MSELKSCPFCGTEAFLSTSDGDRIAIIMCRNALCAARMLFSSIHDVEKQWNTRHEAAKPSDQPVESPYKTINGKPSYIRLTDNLDHAYGQWFNSHGTARHKRVEEEFLFWCSANLHHYRNLKLPVRESIGFVEALKNAEEIVKAYPLYRKFIDGTPLQNDIAVWMAEFAVKGGKP